MNRNQILSLNHISPRFGNVEKDIEFLIGAVKYKQRQINVCFIDAMIKIT